MILASAIAVAVTLMPNCNPNVDYLRPYKTQSEREAATRAHDRYCSSFGKLEAIPNNTNLVPKKSMDWFFLGKKIYRPERKR
jgi:hypothetical protein